MFHEFIGYSTQSESGEYQIKTSILQLARLDAWVATNVENISVTEKRGGSRQKMYSAVYGKFLRQSLKQLVGQIHDFVKEWEPEELQIPNPQADMENRKKDTLGMTREATRTVYFPECGDIYVAVDPSWFCKYIFNSLGTVQDCYICKVDKDFTTMDTIVPSERMSQSVS